MITEIGHFTLIMALFIAIIQGTLPFAGVYKGRPGWMGIAVSASQLQFALVLVAFFALMNGYVASDFTIKNVAMNSHSSKPLIYKISGLWANHEGSMLLWVLILALFGALISLFAPRLPLPQKARVLGVQGLISVAFLAFILFASNPFERLADPPFDGRGMNPLLQDLGLALHPPLLYLGYVGFSIAFAFAAAALLEGKVDTTWARWARPWALIAWVALTAGIALGSWWAYYELGWGGWWFWDPVENASLMPWLVGTAFLHSEKREALKKWTVILAILTFSLSMVGTFLVRSGILSSVHAFATDPARGAFILVILMLIIGSSFALFAWRGRLLVDQGRFDPVSREGGLVLNNMFLSVATATVFIGTLYPLVIDALTEQKLSVGAPYYNMTFVPVMIPAIFIMAIGTLMPWKKGELKSALRRMWLAFIAAIITTVAVLLNGGITEILVAMAFALAVILGVASLRIITDKLQLFKVPIGHSLARLHGLSASDWGTATAHLGMAVLVVGVTAASAWKKEAIQVLKIGETGQVAGYELTLIDVRSFAIANYKTDMATIRVNSGQGLVTVLFPERRVYNVQQRMTTETGIYSNGYSDLYVALGNKDRDGGWVTRFYYNPGVPLIWYGSLFMILGGMVSLLDRRRKVAKSANDRDRLEQILANSGKIVL
jgi:cytochrome c-type biogenesis protein CcmF